MHNWSDPAYVAKQYATEQPLSARRALYTHLDGPDAREVVFAAVAEVRPARVLEVGCGPGEMAERIARDLAAAVVAVDVSPRMVELTRSRGVEARVGDVQDLPFADESFDCVLAAWMLFHVRDLDRALGEIARVLRPGGRLVAATNSGRHVAEVWELVSGPPMELPFSRENGDAILRAHFVHVERRDVDAWASVADRDVLRRYFASTERGRPYVDAVPELAEPLRLGVRTSVFLADTAS
jgi:SAM-dependent methyltransferase